MSGYIAVTRNKIVFNLPKREDIKRFIKELKKRGVKVEIEVPPSWCG